MQFFFDESGNFCPPTDRGQHAVGIVVGVVVPEAVEQDFWRRVRDFISALPESAFKKNEPKGHLLDDEARLTFATLVSEFDAIQVCPTILDLTSIAGRERGLRDGMVAKLEATAAQCEHETMQKQLGFLGKQVGDLSSQQALRLVAWAASIKRCLDDSIFLHSGTEFFHCWTKMAFEIDAVEELANGREEQVFSRLLPAWLTAWSLKTPFVLIDEIHTENHPFVREWDTDRGIDLGRMFRENLWFRPSQSSLGIQVADMAASVVRRAVRRLVTRDDLATYGVMMSKSVRSDRHAHGIISLAEMGREDLARYHGLVESLARARRPHRIALSASPRFPDTETGEQP